MRIMTPWTWSIAYRRFNQGVLIRTGHSKSVGLGTVVRLSANILILVVGFSSKAFPGIVVATGAIISGVLSEAVFSGFIVQPVLRRDLVPSPAIEPPLSWGNFFAFYIPLAMTSLLTLIVNPIGSAAVSRMPQALDSLAVWPVITGLIFFFRSLGVAYNEVVVALLDKPFAYANLKRVCRHTLLSNYCCSLPGCRHSAFRILVYRCIGAAPPLRRNCSEGALDRPAAACIECAAELVPGADFVRKTHPRNNRISSDLPHRVYCYSDDRY